MNKFEANETYNTCTICCKPWSNPDAYKRYWESTANPGPESHSMLACVACQISCVRDFPRGTAMRAVPLEDLGYD